MKAIAFAALAATALGIPETSSAHWIAQPPAYRGDLVGFDRDATALPRLVEAAERRGDRVMKVRYDGLRGHPGYDLVLEDRGRVAGLHVTSPQPSRFRLRRVAGAQRPLDRRDREDARLLTQAPVDLATAIRTAEAASNGAPAVAAGLASSATAARATTVAYNIMLLQPDDRISRIAVDARTGLVITDPQALGGWPA